jgi:hypothetical protein
VEISIKTPPWSVWLNIFERDLMETMELTPNKHKALCEVDWPTFSIGWPPEGSLDKTVIDEAYRVIVRSLGTQISFPILTAGRMLSVAKALSGRGL